MALKKLSKAYGAQYAGLTASLRDMQGQPARCYGLPDGVLPIQNGQITLNSSGGFGVYVDDAKLYQVVIYGATPSVVMLTDFNVEVDTASASNGLTAAQVEAGATSVVGVTNSGTLINGVGTPVSGGAATVAVVSQYDKVLLMAATARQFGAVAGIAQNAADAQYVGAITPAEVYATEAGLISVGQATSKALAIHNTAVEWDLSLGQSLLVQMRAKTVGVTTSSNALVGNSDGSAIEGFGFTVYGPTHATLPGRCTFNFKANGSAGQSIQMQPVELSSNSTNQYAIPTDTLINFTIFVDGRDRRCYVWTNGEQAGSNWGAQLNAGSSLPAVRRNLGLGHVPTNNSYTTAVARATRFRTLRIAVFPNGVVPKSVSALDRAFNANPDVVFTDADYLED